MALRAGKWAEPRRERDPETKASVPQREGLKLEVQGQEIAYVGK